MNMPFISSLFLACFFTFVAAFYTIRLTIGDTSRNVPKIHPGKPYSVTWWNHILFRFFRVLIWGACAIRVFVPQVDNFLFIIPTLMIPPVLLTGMVFMVLGFIIAFASHRQLGELWRSGIDPSAPNQIKKDGLFHYSRNPMYIGVILAQVGFFFALPSVFSLLCLGVGVFTILRQVNAEEKHLLSHLGAEYLKYQAYVPRWIPRFSFKF